MYLENELPFHCQKNPSWTKKAIKLLVLEVEKIKNTTAILQKVTARVNAINNDSSKSEESFLEDFQTFKKSFLAKVNVFKKQLLTSYTTDNVNKSNNSDRLIILLEENIAFLKDQINIDSFVKLAVKAKWFSIT